MVSTRGVKLKFFDGEKVLCYEPDQTKAKVLYDSKVVEVIVNKEQKGRKAVEYLIHFQGWNSSWDRCVSEDFVLKDTPENRQLQKDLANKAQLQLGAYLYRHRRERKQRRRYKPSSEDGSSGSPLMDTDDTTGVTTSSESSSGDEEIIQLELTSFLRHALEDDYFLINGKRKLHKLPAEPHVVAILDKYWKYYSNNELNKIADKPSTRNNKNANQTLPKYKPEYFQRNLNTCKELVDGLRVYFDYTLQDLLLYNLERDQIQTAQATEISICTSHKLNSPLKSDLDDLEYAHLPSFDARLSIDSEPCTRRLRSHRSTDSDNASDYTKIEENHSYNFVWKLLPDYVYNQDPPPPCLIYGATHLTRLLVKLPDLLYASNMAEDKLKILLRHLDMFIEFLSEHTEWFGEKHYNDVST